MLQINQLAGFGGGDSVVLPDQIGVALWGWWAPDSINGTFTLSSWSDRSGNNRTLTPQGSNPDILTTGGPKGAKAIDLDTASVSVNERLEGTDTGANLASWHLFAVIKVIAYATDRFAIYGDNDGGSSGKSPCWTRSANDRLRVTTYDGNLKDAVPNDAVPIAGSWCLFEGFVESGVEVGVNIDNAGVVTTAIGAVSSPGFLDGITLGASGAAGQAMDCTFSELIIYPTRLSPSRRQLIIDYLANQYGTIGSW